MSIGTVLAILVGVVLVMAVASAYGMYLVMHAIASGIAGIEDIPDVTSERHQP